MLRSLHARILRAQPPVLQPVVSGTWPPPEVEVPLPRSRVLPGAGEESEEAAAQAARICKVVRCSCLMGPLASHACAPA